MITTRPYGTVEHVLWCDMGKPVFFAGPDPVTPLP